MTINEVKKAGNQESHLFLLDDKIYRVNELLPKMRSAMAPLRRVRQDLFRDQDVALTFNNSLQFERSKYYDLFVFAGSFRFLARGGRSFDFGKSSKSKP